MLKRLSPEIILRFVSVFCFVGAGLSAIFVASHVGSQALSFVRAQDLGSYFFTALGIFIFFYAQYRLVPRYTKSMLDDRLGYWQSLGGGALLLIGALSDLVSGGSGTLPSTMLWLIAVAGELLFVLNVICSYANGKVPASMKAPERTVTRRDNFGWPKSPVNLFGIAAAVFGAIGIISMTLGLPSFRVPLPWGSHPYAPFGWLWFGAAAPFAFFAFLYKLLARRYGLNFEESLTRIHFVVTIIAILGLSRLYLPWQQESAKTWLTALLLASIVIFAINAYRTIARTAARP